VDCNTARMLVTFFGRQGSELAPEDAAELDTHLAACPACAADVRFERAFDDRVAKAMLAVPIPPNLKAKLLDGVAVQRGAWYRQKFYVLAGMAATVLLSIGGWVAWEIQRAPELTVNAIVLQEDARGQDQTAFVDRYLGEKGLSFRPERPFAMSQLEFVGMGDLNGKEVPVLYFFNGPKNARAKVYMVRDTDFKWKDLPQDGSSQPGGMFGHQVALVRDRNRSDIGYVVVYTGAGLELFLEDRSMA
jgi:Putative zinc-finger